MCLMSSKCFRGVSSPKPDTLFTKWYYDTIDFKDNLTYNAKHEHADTFLSEHLAGRQSPYGELVSHIAPTQGGG
jgi:hypothetical protein